MFIRCAIFVGLSSVVATIIYLTPIPEQTFLSCDRPCHHLDWPMICRMKLTLEVFQSLSKSCGNCLHNETACMASHCVSADGQRRAILAANRQLPGPNIQVCENDILVIDVINRLPGKAAAIHWRGQNQIETPAMDGTPLVTQCPIPSYTTFQYKFRASSPGTHMWHAHAGADVTNGIFGALIVRQADIREPHRSLYDVDDPNHVVMVSRWQHSGDSLFDHGHSKPAILLANGRGRLPDGPKVPLTTFTVIPGRRHRFRTANAAGAGSCPITVSVDGHSLLLIALDGHPVSPQQVTSITLAKGERADFVLKASNRISTYWMKLHTTKECGKPTLSGAAILKYKGSATDTPLTLTEHIDQNDAHETAPGKVMMTTSPVEKCEDEKSVCVTEVQAVRKMPKALTAPKTDVTIYLPINYKMQTNELIGIGTETRVLNVGNATFTFPSSPLLTQRSDVPQDIFCSGDGGEEDRIENNEVQPRKCRRSGGESSDTCECVHVRKIPLGATVEVILQDQGGLDDLVYHLHGYSFYVVGARRFGQSMPLEDIKDLDERGQLFSRNLDCPPLKDTVVVPKFGVVALRFKADNPGYWILRDEHAAEWTRGLDVILKVGEVSDMVSPPDDFPKCGSFVGPEYFLI